MWGQGSRFKSSRVKGVQSGDPVTGHLKCGVAGENAGEIRIVALW